MGMNVLIKVVPGKVEIGKDLQCPRCGEPILGDFKKCVIDAIDAYPPAGKGMKQIREAVVIVGKIEDAEDKFTLTKSEHETVKAAVEACPYLPAVARVYEKAEYFDAIMEPASEPTG